MARPEAAEADKVIETWESAIAGAIWVWLYDRREDRYIKQAVGGRSASKRLHISRDDRKYNQEQVPIENATLDPFTNGALRFVHAATRDESLDQRYHFTDEDLAQLFELRDLGRFSEAISDITSELILRRLMSLAENLATVAQRDTLDALIRERWPIGGSQRTVREMLEAEKATAASRF